MAWHVDEGLAVLIGQWKRLQPGAVVYTIGDENHTTGEHVPEGQGSAPGADRGEVDAADFMPGHGVTPAELVALRHDLLVARDPRLLYLIWHDTIVSSVVQPWVTRKYSGKWHDHLHVSVNDRFDRNTSAWDLEAGVAREYAMMPIPSGVKLPELRVGDEDVPGKTGYIKRVQRLLGVDDDGAYGPVTARALAARMATQTSYRPSSTNGAKLYMPEWRVLYALW